MMIMILIFSFFVNMGPDVGGAEPLTPHSLNCKHSAMQNTANANCIIIGAVCIILRSHLVANDSLFSFFQMIALESEVSALPSRNART